MTRKSKAVVRKHQVRAMKCQPERNGANEIKSNCNGSASHKKRTKKLSHDLVKLGVYCIWQQQNKVKDLTMNVP